jgi:hypothetical protein
MLRFATIMLSVFALGCSTNVVTTPAPAPNAASADRVLDVRLDVEQAEAALAILETQAGGGAPSEAQWRRVFESAGYQRLKEREASMSRAFDDEAFRAFLTAPEQIARAADLRATLTEWRAMSVDAAAERAFEYLPPNASIRATVYITIKPRTNSFVFDVERNPAIFLYLNPEQSAAKTQNTVAHELHHIGFGTTCPPQEQVTRNEALPPAEARLRVWMGGYGEGFAMLAAGGGLERHPHADSPDAERVRWDRDIAAVPEQMADQAAFFGRITSGELTDIEAIDAQGRTYFGEQGPWYTVGYAMASTIERAFGREQLIDTMCRQAPLLTTYNEAARTLNARDNTSLPLWDDALAARIAR